MEFSLPSELPHLSIRSRHWLIGQQAEKPMKDKKGRQRRQEKEKEKFLEVAITKESQ